MRIFGDEVHPNYTQVTTSMKSQLGPQPEESFPKNEVIALFNEDTLLLDISGSFFLSWWFWSF